MPNQLQKYAVYLALAGLAVFCSASALADSTNPLIVVDYHLQSDGQMIVSQPPEISLPAGTKFDLVIRYDNATGINHQLRVVLPDGINYLNSDPAPSAQAQYSFTYDTPAGDPSFVNIVSLNLETDKTLNEGELAILTFMQNADQKSSNYPLAYQYAKIMITKPVFAAGPVLQSNIFGGFSSGVFWLWLLVAILALILIAFWILNSLLTLPEEDQHPSALTPVNAGDGGKTAVLGFSFGLRGIEPGLSNESMAQVIKNSYAEAVKSVQWEIGNALNKLGIEADHRITKNITVPGKYLDTEEVAKQMKDFLATQPDITDIRVIAHDKHMPRVLKTLKKFGINAKPGSANIPYDPESSQIWTRSPFLFKIRELMAWPFYILKGVA